MVKAAWFHRAVRDGFCGHGKGSDACGVDEELPAGSDENTRSPLFLFPLSTCLILLLQI